MSFYSLKKILRERLFGTIHLTALRIQFPLDRISSIAYIDFSIYRKKI